MSQATDIYAANFGHSHEAAVEAVWNAAFQAGAEATKNIPAELVTAPVMNPSLLIAENL